MCGIVGLHVKNPELYPRLGELLTPMLDCMASRGPDSAGIALYADVERADGDGSGREARRGKLRWSVRADAPTDWHAVADRLTRELGVEIGAQQRADGAVLTVPAAGGGSAERFHSALDAAAPEAIVVGFGTAMEVHKDVGAPIDICERYEVPKRAGYQGMGHTRMATESAVTTDHSHPFAPAADLALVHNGSFSNHASVRRRLEQAGVRSTTDNDSEVAARYIGYQMEQGRDLGDSLRMVLKEFDGFFTLLVTTRTQFAVVRDSFACKPMVVAETPDYVAVASEYHALAGLPGIGAAEVFEPMPEEVHTWTR